MSNINKLKNTWNMFLNRDPTTDNYQNIGNSYYSRPDRRYNAVINSASMITPVYNRIALDVANINIQHVLLDSDGRFLEEKNTGLNSCLTLEANLDQTNRAFIQDIVMSMFDEGCVALVPIETNINIYNTEAYDIISMRTAKILEWMPNHIKVRVYNERTGEKEDVIVEKRTTAIIENPLYSVVNSPNSTMKRLVRKLNLLDSVDEQSGSGKLDLIVRVPYSTKNDRQRVLAEERRKGIEDQLNNSKFGIAYIDGTEEVTQLNRPIENNLTGQVEYLTNMLYGQLGITPSILDGTADEKTMLNYYNRSIEPIIASIVDEMKRKFLSKTARTQKQSIIYFRDPFRLVPVNDLADIADKFTRNEILTSNEVRQIIGSKPSKDPKADELRNKNLNEAVNKDASEDASKDITKDSESIKEEIQNGR